MEIPDGNSMYMSSPQNMMPSPVQSQQQDPGSCLSNEDFETLIKSIQLLRISQLRYLVQKFSIPASGNKTKLLGLMISIFQSLRYDKILIDIYQEINLLIAQQEEPFNNPLAFIGHIEPTEQDPSFFPPQSPIFRIHYQQPTFGPLAAPVGSSNGSFSFDSLPDRPYVLAFLFSGGEPATFSLQCELNGFAFEVSKDDPFPQPLEISHVLISKNLLTIKLMTTTAPMQIIICEYEYFGLTSLLSQVCGHPVDSSTLPKLNASSRNCSHSETFNLVPFLSKALATGNWSCPVCHSQIQISDIQIRESTSPFDLPDLAAPPSNEMWFQNDLFKQDAFDWDAF